MNDRQAEEMHIGLPAEATAVPTARAAAKAACESWAIGPESAQIVGLIVSEFATNVVRHVGGAFRLTVRLQRDTIRIEVEDPLACPSPQSLAPDPLSEQGRGLLMVERLASTWGCESMPEGKCMWAQVAS